CIESQFFIMENTTQPAANPEKRSRFPVLPFGNLYPNSGKQAKKVEIPVATDHKSQPKRRKIPPAQT
ncbi:hypothetical protein, partial [Eshraghiella crossota]|uniref:hypothetical protein n=1 Tax=Eshraghiella crossota TaxID=45851 RepID=UPI00402744C9